MAVIASQYYPVHFFKKANINIIRISAFVPWLGPRSSSLSRMCPSLSRLKSGASWLCGNIGCYADSG